MFKTVGKKNKKNITKIHKNVMACQTCLNASNYHLTYNNNNIF